MLNLPQDILPGTRLLSRQARIPLPIPVISAITIDLLSAIRGTSTWSLACITRQRGKCRSTLFPGDFRNRLVCYKL